ncbi:flavodoxin FldB [Erwinia sp. OLTSP20]|uniref:flavodoxin FldB n=1 Tax=unclassified Erwinia TaxID=2622719 RepID=UPI000C1A706B|nr:MULTISPECIES: flavodoxin FldB [unclassified Erwinia]PIJ49073.1 flavodoxin FldB [Erwinia sp. OAMSP11]PIJ75060.1 flavodoxin FldB [Erwinia sp. OLSSP12]PIJ79757.1 flavodoxin FldB [Erwinia sp. OLCASP19]PIJ80542.1 flavodoxin FldB [Erwinia sp. OLMTSP26]PIJ82656.1 flavodoxin FldB [Erwinia sp. OLMDSP33]
MKIGLFYGSSTCYTEMAAEKIRDIIGEELVTLHNLKDDDPALMTRYDFLILGIPTWDFGELQEDWEAIWHRIPQLDLRDKLVALYGMGDQLGYGEWFLDALGMLHDLLLPMGVRFIGYWPNEGYEFTSSKPLTADGRQFVGLALDDVNQYDLSDSRLASWCEQILTELADRL